MSDLLGIGASAVSAYRTALSTIGENVANAETPGYARREVKLREGYPGGSNDIFFQENLQFGGVRAESISRAWDQFRAADARMTAGAAGRTDAREAWLTNVETALEDGASGVGSLVGKFFNAGTALSANPDDALGRRAMLMALDDVTNAFRGTAGSLARVSDGIASRAGLEVDGLNNDLAALDNVNGQILRAANGTPVRASLEDERDRILDSIAGRIDINVKIDARGLATVSMANAPTAILVDPSGRNPVSMQVAADGRLSLQFHANGAVNPLPVSGGTLAGLADAAAVTADRRIELDAIAQQFATAVNNWQAQGRTPANVAGAPLLQVSAGAASIQVLTSDPAAIAAASADGTANGNLLTLADMRGTGGAESRWASMVAGHALLLSSAKSEASAAATRRDNSYAARDEASGVDLDQEAAELMRYQQAYNGATRIIQVARETMQSILDLF